MIAGGELSRAQLVRADVTAAVTVALVGLPQCLAYAILSGLPPAYGLATAIVPGLVAALAGRSPHVVTGPTNTTGILILAALTPYLGENGLLAPEGLGVLATLTLLAGLLRVIVSYAGGAALVDFIPASVLTGFTAGAGILIAVMQLDEGLGLSGVRAGGLIEELLGVIAALRQSGPAWPATWTAFVTAVAVAAGRRIRPNFPTALLAIVLATSLALLSGMDKSDGLPVIADRAAVVMGWPQGAWPAFSVEVLRSTITPAAAITLLGTMELAVSARRGGDRPDMRREVLAQGLANLAGAFTSAFPASASLTRSALLKLGGSRSRLAPALASLMLVPMLFVGGPFIGAMPQASLAGVLFVVAVGMIDVRRIRRLWVASRVTRSLLVVTLGATLVLPLEWAILLGAGLGIADHLAHGMRPRVVLLEPKGERLVPLKGEPEGDCVVVVVTGDVHFAAATRLLQRIERALPAAVDHVIVDLSHARALRFSALLVFEDLARRIEAGGGQLHLAGVVARFGRLLQDTGSRLEFTPYDPEPMASVRRVLARIREPASR